MELSKDVAVWFEIPVTDIGRAAKFYETVLESKLERAEFGPTKMAIFPIEGKGVHGALVQGPDYTPATNGPLLYLNGGKDLTGPLSRITAAGGKVLQPKTAIGQHGFMALFVDTEGNRLALHSPT